MPLQIFNNYNRYCLQSCVHMKQERLSLWVYQTVTTFVLFVKIYSLTHFSLNADTMFVANVVTFFSAPKNLNAPRVVNLMHLVMLDTIIIFNEKLIMLKYTAGTTRKGVSGWGR